MDNPPAEKLLKKIRELEESQEDLKREMSKLKVSAEIKRRSHSASPKRPSRRNSGDGTPLWRKSGAASFRHASPLRKESHSKAGAGEGGPSAGKFNDKQYLNILQSMAQAVHVFDLNGQIIFWNSMAEKLYGFSAAEALGKDSINILVDGQDAAVAQNIFQRCSSGESWTGEFPVKNKAGERFSVVTTISPFYDDAGSLIGIICITNDSALFQHPRVPPAKTRWQEGEMSRGTNGVASRLGLDSKEAVVSKLGLDSQQPIQVAIASKISDLASKVGNKLMSMRAGDNNAAHPEGGNRDSHQSDQGFFDASFSDKREDAATSGPSAPRGALIQSPFGVFLCNDEESSLKPSRDTNDENEGNSVIPKTLTSKTEESMIKEGLSGPWKGNEREGLERRHAHSVWPWVQNEQQKQKEEARHNNSSNGVKAESQACESNKPANTEAMVSINVNSTSSASSSGSTTSSVMNKVDMDSDCLDYEILWEDLTIGEQIGQGDVLV